MTQENNADNFLSAIQQGFRTAIGATASLGEALQDPAQRDRLLTDLTENFDERAKEWAERGEVTEQEARRFVEDFLQQQGISNDTPAEAPAPETESDRAPVPVSGEKTTATLQAELRQITVSVKELKRNLEAL